MSHRRSMFSVIVLIVVGGFLAGCSGDSVDSGETIVTGLITLPAADKCLDLSGTTGCRTSDVKVVVTALPTTTIETNPTSSDGVYSTSDLTSFLEENVPDDGSGRSFIVVASVANQSAPTPDQTRIGGILPQLRTGSVATKDFNPTTHIACVGAVYLTGGPNPLCPLSELGLSVLPSTAIDDLRTNILEQASSEIAADVVFPTEVPASTCAVLECTQGGSVQAPPGCVADRFRSYQVLALE